MWVSAHKCTATLAQARRLFSAAFNIGIALVIFFILNLHTLQQANVPKNVPTVHYWQLELDGRTNSRIGRFCKLLQQPICWWHTSVYATAIVGICSTTQTCLSSRSILLHHSNYYLLPTTRNTHVRMRWPRSWATFKLLSVLLAQSRLNRELSTAPPFPTFGCPKIAPTIIILYLL